jgi:hypothetical protein
MHMLIATASRSKITLATCAALLALAPALRAQGLSYDMTTTATGPDPRTGAAMTRVYSSSHGQFAKGMSRLDFVQSMAPGGMMGTGTYMITNTAKGTTTNVDPAKRQYFVLDMAELAKTAADIQKSLGGVAKTEMTDVKVGVEDLGAGEQMEGVATYKYRLTESFTMKMSVMGHDMSSTTHTTSDVWIAPSLDPLMDPSAKAAMSAPNGATAELSKQILAAYSTMKKGLMLKRVSVNESGSGSKTRSTTITTLITNVKHAPISPSVFEVPAGYTEVKSLAEFSGMLDAGAAHSRKPR